MTLEAHIQDVLRSWLCRKHSARSILKKAFAGQLTGAGSRTTNRPRFCWTESGPRREKATARTVRPLQDDHKEEKDDCMNTAPIVSKVWSFCTTLRDDGVSYGDYLEQLTYLIFLKMADEYAKPLHNRDVGIPAEYNWQSLTSKKGAELERPLRHPASRELGTKKGHARARSLPRPRTRFRTRPSCSASSTWWTTPNGSG